MKSRTITIGDRQITTKLKPYMGYAGDPEYGACLVFAFTARQAREDAYIILSGWCDDNRWIDIRTNLLRDRDFLYKEGDIFKLEHNIPHGVEFVETCDYCELWGSEIGEDKLCSACRDAKKLNEIHDTIIQNK